MQAFERRLLSTAALRAGQKHLLNAAPSIALSCDTSGYIPVLQLPDGNVVLDCATIRKSNSNPRRKIGNQGEKNCPVSSSSSILLLPRRNSATAPEWRPPVTWSNLTSPRRQKKLIHAPDHGRARVRTPEKSSATRAHDAPSPTRAAAGRVAERASRGRKKASPKNPPRESSAPSPGPRRAPLGRLPPLHDFDRAHVTQASGRR